MTTSNCNPTLPNPAISLPLIKGLSTRSADAPKHIVSALLHEYVSYCTIQRALRIWLYRRRGAVNDKYHHDQCDSFSSGSNFRIPKNCTPKYGRCYIPIHKRRHWMWRAFLSANLRVRRIVFRILLDGLYQLENDKGNKQYFTDIDLGKVCSYYQRLCIGIVVELIDENLQRCIITHADDYYSDEDPFVKQTELEGGEPIIQFMSVLLHLIMLRRLPETQKGSAIEAKAVEVADNLNQMDVKMAKTTITNLATNTEQNDSSNISNANKNNEVQVVSVPITPRYEKLSLGIEDFVAGSGLRWVVRWMLHLCNLLCTKGSKTSSSYSSIDSSIYIRLHMMVDFTYRLLYKNVHLNNTSVWKATNDANPIVRYNDFHLATLPSLILIAHVFVRQLKGHSNNIVSSGVLKVLLAKIIDPTDRHSKKYNKSSQTKVEGSSLLSNLRVNSISASDLINSANRGLQLPSASFILSRGDGGLGEIEDIIMADDEEDDYVEDEGEPDEDEDKDDELDLLDDVGDEDMEDDVDEEMVIDGDDYCENEEEDDETELEHSQSDSEGEIEQEIQEQHDVVVDDDDDEEEEEEAGLQAVHEDEMVENHQAFELLHQQISDSQGLASQESVLLSSSLKQNASGENDNDSKPVIEDIFSSDDRKHCYLAACVKVLESQVRFLPSKNVLSSCILCQEGIMSLIKSMCDVVRPPPKPLALKVFMRRAPSQEEFFRGSLLKNPIAVSTLKSASGTEPTMNDLRQHIANDLQMSDSAELLELLVGGKIINLSLKVRVVQQVLWVKYVCDSTDSGYSSDTSASSLPPMVVTYRLAGVDGEATEDKVESVIDPKDSGQIDAEKEYAITKVIADAGSKRCFFLLLRVVEVEIGNTLRKIRRDDIMGTQHSFTNHSKELFIKNPPCPALVLLQLCSNLKSNRKLMVKARAPTKMLKILIDVLSIIDSNSLSKGNGKSTAECLQSLIETLASDISTISDVIDDDNEDEQDFATVELLLQSLTESSLAAPLRKVISDLLPFLTYGQRLPSKALASKFVEHVKFEELSDKESYSILMDTFIQTSISLPTVSVCNELRGQLLLNGFVKSTANFIVNEVPDYPPPWVPSLFVNEKVQTIEDENKGILEVKWRKYFGRNGLQKCFKILIGLSNQHEATQHFLVDAGNLINLSHWIESTSDTGDLGLLAETFLDVLRENNAYCTKKIDSMRQLTKARKKELADSRKNQALMNINLPSHNISSIDKLKSTSVVTKAQDTSNSSVTIPAWMAEMEAMEEEDGLTCAVCQEGRIFQPTEMLGLYVYMKKVIIPSSKGGSKSDIEGIPLFSALPLSIPISMQDSLIDEVLFRSLKSILPSVRNQSSLQSGLSSSSRQSVFVTTVTAGNAIHYSCHSKAKQADRNHPKAPKGEWEGAGLRNSRVSCNAIMPLLSCANSSEIPLVIIDATLANYQSAITGIIGSRPKVMVWNVLHDVRLLLLRIAYEESLSSDCGGGSLTSNVTLIFHLFLMANMFIKTAEVESPSLAKYVKFLAAAFIFGMEVVEEKKSSLHRAAIDSSFMASICCILFNKKTSDDGNMNDFTFARGLWKKSRSTFIRGLLRLGGRRKRQGLENSGCTSSRLQNRKSIKRDDSVASENSKSVLGKRCKYGIEDIDVYLRPMIMLIVILEHLSESLDLNSMDDAKISSSTESLVDAIEKYRKTKNIHELCSLADLKINEEQIYAEFDIGHSIRD